MKKMKFFLVSFILLGLGSLCFSSVDLQLGIGARGTNSSFDLDYYNYNYNYYRYVYDFDEDFGGFDIYVANYNLFKIGKIVSIGFMEGAVAGIEAADEKHIDLGIGSFDVFAGPALSFNLKNIVKFQGMAGIGLGARLVAWDVDHGGDGDDNTGVVSFVTEAQAKFLPRLRFSPIAGFRYIYSSYTVNIFDHSEDTDIETNTFSLYAGISLNLFK